MTTAPMSVEPTRKQLADWLQQNIAGMTHAKSCRIASKVTAAHRTDRKRIAAAIAEEWVAQR